MDRADLELVLAIRDHGSLAAAASSLHLEPPAVTKRLAALESRLGQSLFQRTTRRVRATAEGDVVCQRAEALLRGFVELEAELQERKREPTGLIRLVSTFGFGRLWLGPAVALFQKDHPRVSIELHLTEQLPEVAQDSLDAAVWLWPVRGQQASRWQSRRLARNQRVMVASPTYLALRGTPASLDELQQHSCLQVRENGGGTAGKQQFDVWHLQNLHDKAQARVRVQGPFSSNSGELVRDWCLQGHGIMLRSLWDIGPHLASGELVHVLPAWAMPDADIYWLAPYRNDSPRRLRLLTDHLVRQFSSEPWRTSSGRN